MRQLMPGALAALLAATPALAQTQPAFGACDLAAMPSAVFETLDVDDDASLSPDEYRACAEDAGLALDDAAAGAFELAFTQTDIDQSGSLTFEEIESVGETDTAEPTPPVDAVPPVELAPGAPSATDGLAPGSPAATDGLGPGAPGATDGLGPGAPAATEQEAVPQGTVTVTQPAAEVEVAQPSAEIDVTAPAPQVAVEQPQPEVDVTAPAPQAESTLPPADPGSATAVAPPADAAAPSVPSAPVAVEPAVPAAPAAPDVAAATQPAAEPTFQIKVEDLERSDVINTAGEEIGRVADVLLDPTTNAPVVIVAVGGLLGIGDHEVAFPYGDFTITGGDVVLNRSVGVEEIEAMPGYDETAYEPLPDTMRVR